MAEINYILQIAIYRDFIKNGLTQTSCKSVPGGLEPQGLQEAAVEKMTSFK